VIKTPKNQTFIDADFASIENRIAYWVVDDKHHLDLFINGEDEYKKFASIMYRKPVNDISANERQVAKSAVLGCMYGAGAKTYKEYAQGYGIIIHDAMAKYIVDTYRATHPYIVGGWKNCEEAALLAIYHSKLTQYEKLQFDGRTDGILKIKLPSGRDMIFQKPYIGTGRFGGSVVKVMGTEATTKRYIEIDLYPSKLFQNIVQAIARDVLVNAMEQITDDTGNLVASFHDEILLTTDKNKGEENWQQQI